MYQLKYQPYSLDFTFKAGTSRGVMTQRDGWYITLTSKKKPGIIGRGEVAPLRGLSQEDISLIPSKLDEIAENISYLDWQDTEKGIFNQSGMLAGAYSSIRFGLEMALLDLFNGGKQLWFENDFTLKNKPIPINGLIWMGDKDFMTKQIYEKLEAGFNCIKVKIGAIDFEQELEILKLIRSLSAEIMLRVDANGAFQLAEVLFKLQQLEGLGIHSVEQPILPRQPEAMELICRKSPIPIALDEELIGIQEEKEKIALIEQIKPQFLVLKPSLLGGFSATNQWIEIASKQKIDWWVTSALESNLGLSAIAQFCGNFKTELHQGLGTGSLFHINHKTATNVKNGMLYFDKTSLI